MRLLYFIICVKIMSATCNINARAELLVNLSVKTKPQTGGRTLYQYTLAVLPKSSEPCVGLNLNVGSSANLQIGPYPPGWEVVYEPDDPSIGWGTKQFSPGLPPGSRMMLSFTSALPPVVQEYSIFGIDKTGQNGGMITGRILGPGIADDQP
jgi:hypothetical protein